jgi:hypothetical protein
MTQRAIESQQAANEMIQRSLGKKKIMTREEFLQERQTLIGGSDAGSLFNVGYGCYRRLIQIKRGVPGGELESTAPMELGVVLEPYIRERLARETGWRIENPTDAMRHHLVQQFGAHVDGVIYRPDRDTPGVLEIKALGLSAFGKAKREGLNESYILQVQHGCAVTGFKWGVFAVLCRDNGAFIHFTVEADPEMGAMILAKVEEAWVLKENGPLPEPLPPTDQRCARCGYYESCHESEYMGLTDQPDGIAPWVPELGPLATRYAVAKAKFDEADAEFDEVKEQIKELLASKTEARGPGLKKVTYRSSDVKEYVVKARSQRTLRVTL